MNKKANPNSPEKKKRPTRRMVLKLSKETIGEGAPAVEEEEIVSGLMVVQEDTTNLSGWKIATENSDD